MKTPKTIELIECRKCGGSYYGGKIRITLRPGDEKELPDELVFAVRKIGQCTSCKERDPRTKGGRRLKFER